MAKKKNTKDINEVKKRHRQRAKRIRNYIKVINKVESKYIEL